MKSPTFVSIAVLATFVMTSQVQAQWGSIKVVTATAELKPLPVTITVVGTVQPVLRSTIGAEVAGLVAVMPVREGDLIAEGGLVCKLKEDTLALQVACDDSHLAALQAVLDELVNGTRPEDLARLKAQYESASAIFDKWEFELARVKKLYGDEHANAKEYYDTSGEHLAAKGRMLAAKASYDLGLAGPRREVITRARHDVAQQQGIVDLARTDLAKTEIRAPFAGFIVQRPAEIGQWVELGGDVVEIADLSSVLVRIDVPEHAIPFATVGSKASVYVDALDATFEGKIKHVIPQADPAARTFPVVIAVPNRDFALKAGMFARATVIAGKEQEMVAVPKDAISRQAGASYVALIVPGENDQMMAMPTPVTVGLDIGDWIAITSGNIPAGSQVVVRGNEGITQMMAPAPVEVVNKPLPPKQRPPKQGPPDAETTSSRPANAGMSRQVT